jgi:KAP family P-loop domain
MSQRVHVVELNAWAYSASEAVWPSLVRKVMECGEHQIAWPFPGRFARKLWSNLSWELHQERGKLLAALLAASVLLTIVLWRLDFNVKVLAAVAAGLGATGLLKVVADTLANPLTKWMTTVLKGGDYGEDIEQMRRIRHDLDVLSRRLEEENGRIVVLIDDLDRCEPEKIIEVLQAINLLLNFKSYIVCLGIDARLVTRAIERHYNGLLEEAHASGYEYLDKIVRIPFRIPRPGEHEVQSFLETQLRDAQEGLEPTSPEAATPSPTTPLPPEEATSSTAVPAAALQGTEVEPPKELSAERVAFTDDEIAAFDELAPFLEPNPRHLKRIVNVYRLVRSRRCAMSRSC